MVASRNEADKIESCNETVLLLVLVLALVPAFVAVQTIMIFEIRYTRNRSHPDGVCRLYGGLRKRAWFLKPVLLGTETVQTDSVAIIAEFRKSMVFETAYE